MIIPVTELIASAKSHCSCLDPAAAKQFFDEHDNAVIIDVREPKEVEESSLNGSVNIPRGLLEMKITEVCPEPDRPVLVHCAAGGRSSLAAHTLKIMGYTNVHVIDAKLEDIKAAFD